MKTTLNLLMNEIDDFYRNIEESSFIPKVSPTEIRDHLHSHYDFTEPVDFKKLFKDVAGMMRKWNIHVTHPRYFGLFNPAVKVASVVADALVALYNPQLATWSHAPAANEIEQFTLKFLLSHFGFNPDTSVAHFTTGGAEANLSAVIVALTEKFPDFETKGLRGVPSQPVFYISEEAHHSFHKIAHITGLGRDSLRTVAVDSSLKMDSNDLIKKIKYDISLGHTPFMVVGTAGATSSGIIDELPLLADICSEYDLWFHVDAAWGGAAVLSPRLKPFLEGIERADSITCDAHKWLSVPMGAGMFFCRHQQALARAFRSTAIYMPQAVQETSDFYLTSIQWSRRFIGLKLFMTLAELGRDGIIQLINHQTAMGEELRDLLRKNGWAIINDTPLPLVCFTHERIDKGEISTRFIIDRLYEEQKVWISETCLMDKMTVLRACITNYRTQQRDIAILVDELNKLVCR